MHKKSAPPSPPFRPSLLQYVMAWLVVTAWLANEYLCLNKVFCSNLPRLLKSSPSPGSAISFKLGWIGFIIIVLTNAYILRKRMPSLKNAGRLPAWLDFHIFCGLLGPTIIVFHCNFQVGGLVAISFWSMMISFASGIAGRYLYMQLLSLRADTKRQLAFYEESFRKCQALTKPPLPDAVMQRYKNAAILLAGGTPLVMSGAADPFRALALSIAGDIRLFLYAPAIPPGFPRGIRQHLRRYGVLRRKVATTGYFQRLMGYWHTFHAPFAIFMYVVSVIHIASALIFRVNH